MEFFDGKRCNYDGLDVLRCYWQDKGSYIAVKTLLLLSTLCERAMHTYYSFIETVSVHVKSSVFITLHTYMLCAHFI